MLDQLYETMTAVSQGRPNLKDFDREFVGAAMVKLARIFEDRIFIADRLKDSAAKADWYELKKLVYYDPELQEMTPKELQYSRNKVHDREDKLREKLLGLARQDIVKFRFFGMIQE